MQRGILTLTKEESVTAIQLSKISDRDLSVLVSRLNLAVNSSEDVSTIEVDREEVEALLDVLPIPSEDEDSNYKLLRDNLSIFLAKKNE